MGAKADPARHHWSPIANGLELRLVNLRSTTDDEESQRITKIVMSILRGLGAFCLTGMLLGTFAHRHFWIVFLVSVFSGIYFSISRNRSDPDEGEEEQ